MVVVCNHDAQANHSWELSVQPQWTLCILNSWCFLLWKQIDCFDCTEVTLFADKLRDEEGLVENSCANESERKLAHVISIANCTTQPDRKVAHVFNCTNLKQRGNYMAHDVVFRPYTSVWTKICRREFLQLHFEKQWIFFFLLWWWQEVPTAGTDVQMSMLCRLCAIWSCRSYN